MGIQNLQLQQAINAAQQQHDTMVISQAVASAKGGISGYGSSSLPKQGGLSMDAEAADSGGFAFLPVLHSKRDVSFVVPTCMGFQSWNCSLLVSLASPALCMPAVPSLATSHSTTVHQ